MALPTISRWQNRVALVTGASIGIGAEIAKLLVSYGVNVVGCARSKENLEAVAKECENLGSGKFHPYVCDLSSEKEIEGMYEWIKKNHGGVDICINNAGFSSGESVLDASYEKTRKMYEINVLALMKCTTLAVKSMEERGVNDGHIININSALGHYVKPRAETHAYGATKYAVSCLTEGLRLELNQRKSKIRVTSISPAMVDTNFHQTAYGEEEGAKVRNVLPSLKAKDVADAVIYALSAPPTVQIHDILFRAVGAD